MSVINSLQKIMIFVSVFTLFVLITELSCDQTTDEKHVLINDKEEDVEEKRLTNFFVPFKGDGLHMYGLSTTSKPKQIKTPVLAGVQTFFPGKYEISTNRPQSSAQEALPKPSTDITSTPSNLEDNSRYDNSDSIKSSHKRHDPITIQEWMNENRPLTQHKNPNHNSGSYVELQSESRTKPNIGRPSPLKPSQNIAPWLIINLTSKPTTETEEIEEDDDPWALVTTSNKPNIYSEPKQSRKPETQHSITDNQKDEESPQKPKRPKTKPNLNQQSEPRPPLYWGEVTSRPIYPKPTKSQTRPSGTPVHSIQETTTWMGSLVDREPPIWANRPELQALPGKPEQSSNPNESPWWHSKPALPEFEGPESEINGWGGNIFGDNSGNGLGGNGDINGIGGVIIGSNSGNGEGGVGNLNGLGGNIISNNGANGVGGIGNNNGQGGFIIGNNSGNGKGGIGNNNGIGGNKGGRNSANGTGGVGNNNGRGGILVGNNSGNGIGGVNQNQPSLQNHDSE